MIAGSDRLSRLPIQSVPSETYDETPVWGTPSLMATTRTRTTMRTNEGIESSVKLPALKIRSSGAVGLAGAAHRRRNGEGEGQDLAEDDDLDVDRERRFDGAPDRRAGDERRAEVAVQDVLDPDEILLDDGLVESELLIELDAVRGTVAGAEDDRRGISGQQMDEVEGSDGDDKDDADQHDQPLQ